MSNQAKGRLIAAGFGAALYKRGSRYYMRENGYTSSVTPEHAAMLMRSIPLVSGAKR